MDAKLAVIDDLSREPPLSTIGTRWQLFTDRVMGGVSDGTISREIVGGRPAIRMRGAVSLENSGGFVQIAIDLTPDGKAKDAGDWGGVKLDVFGNGEEYNVHLRTEDLHATLAIISPELSGWSTMADGSVPFSRFRTLPHRYCS